MNKIEVNICQNDSNGNLTDRAVMMDFSLPDGETFLRLEAKNIFDPQFPGVKCICTDLFTWRIEIYGVRVKHDGRTDWAGNMHWNLYHFNQPQYALGLLRVLQLSKEWSWLEGWSTITSKWDKGEEITGADLELDEDYQPMFVNPDQLKIFR